MGERRQTIQFSLNDSRRRLLSPEKINSVTLHCCLELCEACQEYGLHVVETEMDVSTSLQFQVYAYYASCCSLHGMIPNGATVCPSCKTLLQARKMVYKALDEDDMLPEKPIVGIVYGKIQLHPKCLPVGAFMQDVYLPQLKKYRYHLMLVGDR